MMVLTHALIFSALLFAVGIMGVMLNRKNLIVMLLSIELILLAVNTNFIAFNHFAPSGQVTGQIFVFFILTVAAAESAIGLAILVCLFRQKRSINIEELDRLKG